MSTENWRIAHWGWKILQEDMMSEQKSGKKEKVGTGEVNYRS